MGCICLGCKLIRPLEGPALHRTRPYIYPTLLLRVTNMGMVGGGSPSYLPTMWSGPYIVMIVSVTVALTSTYRLTPIQSLEWLDAKRRPSLLSATLWLGLLTLSLYHPSLPTSHSHTLVETHRPVSISLALSFCVFIYALKSATLIQITIFSDLSWAQHTQNARHLDQKVLLLVSYGELQMYQFE